MDRWTAYINLRDDVVFQRLNYESTDCTRSRG